MSYPNMSYCMFENTLLAMTQIIRAMGEGDFSFDEMSREEIYAARDLVDACQEYLVGYDDLTEEI
jgi:TRAP-type mannitol/chloroaromatic compound transport system substrate-binding protein